MGQFGSGNPNSNINSNMGNDETKIDNTENEEKKSKFSRIDNLGEKFGNLKPDKLGSFWSERTKAQKVGIFVGTALLCGFIVFTFLPKGDEVEEVAKEQKQTKPLVVREQDGSHKVDIGSLNESENKKDEEKDSGSINQFDGTDYDKEKRDKLKGVDSLNSGPHVDTDVKKKEQSKIISQSEAVNQTDKIVKSKKVEKKKQLTAEQVNNSVPSYRGSSTSYSSTRRTSYTSSRNTGNVNLNIKGGIGALSIPSIGLNARVNASPDLLDHGSDWNIPALRNGVGHYPNTSTFDGTVGIAGHNTTYFRNLDKVQVGDIIHYNYNGMVRSYKVTSMNWINHDDWNLFNNQTGGNELVLTTCERGNFPGRLLVKAVETNGSGDTYTNSFGGTVAGSDGASDSYGAPIGSYAKKGDNRGRNGHKNDVVDGHVPKIQDFYQDSGYNDPVDVFTGDVSY